MNVSVMFVIDAAVKSMSYGILKAIIMYKLRSRVLNEEQIRAMPFHNLKRYRDAILTARKELHKSLNDWGRTEAPSENEVKLIRTLDWLAARCNEQFIIKKP